MTNEDTTTERYKCDLCGVVYEYDPPETCDKCGGAFFSKVDG